MTDIYAERRKLAKRANQRLLRLERAGKARFAYDSARAFIENIYGEKQGKVRFSESLQKSRTKRSIQHEINVLNEFLSMPTSTVKGQEKLKNKSFDTLVKNFAKRHEDDGRTLDLSTVGKREDLVRFLESEAFKHLAEKKGVSDIMLDIYERWADLGKDIDELIDAYDDYANKEGAPDPEDLVRLEEEKKEKEDARDNDPSSGWSSGDLSRLFRE